MLTAMTASRTRLTWLTWAVCLGVVLLGLGLQVRYAEEALACASGDALVLCSGPLAPWLMPMTVLVGLALVALAAWRLMATPR